MEEEGKEINMAPKKKCKTKRRLSRRKYEENVRRPAREKARREKEENQYF